MEDALRALEGQAVASHDGHLTLFRFTTGWKAFLGTVDIHPGCDYEAVWVCTTYATPEEALSHPVDVYALKERLDGGEVG